MKKYFNYAVLTVFCFIISSCSIDVSNQNEEKIKAEGASTTAIFNVWGNCDMCKETIEGSLKVPGISKADWNSDTKIMKVNYDSSLISVDQIQKSIASVGYDTEKYRGNDSAYTSLHECCQYERKE